MNPLLQWLGAMPASLRSPLAIILGAIPGALARYYATIFLARIFGNDLPYATFLINFSGCVGMGLVVTLATQPALLSPDLRLLLAVGFLGSYTTFSTYALEVTSLWRTGQLAEGILYGLGSLVIGAIGVLLGSLIAHRLSI
ncbi:fluoride efflux transporter CrcB [Synechocystis sp. FACHB-383]|uniref:fluoride efflux transporter CrcB n=1 Tax=unclassified Synechocystis TaxID=2640012 RepID=UPI001687216C|nr:MULTISPECIES: fluoride efflux transporter CrcB [unclassified Synechocystis]MBD2653723.1 fluoride efflux transporter CrcB [Synechocystis sp. FACHB-383]MBE9195060.1 fluoride efflux transporter CrcB [Synechocystis sp. LEGE 06083]